MGSNLKHAGFIRYRGSSNVTRDQIIEEFSFEYNNYAFATLFFREAGSYIFQITTLEENHITRWRAYIDLEGHSPTGAAIIFGGRCSRMYNSSCILKTSYDAMRSFWMVLRNPKPKSWQIRHAMKRYSFFLKKIERHVAHKIIKDGFSFARKYRREGLHVYWLCKRANNSFVNQIDQVCPSLLSALAYGLRKGYFSLSFVDVILFEIKRGKSIKVIGRRIFEYLKNNVLDIDLRMHHHWNELQRIPSHEVNVAFNNWWKLMRLGTRGTLPSIHISAPLVYFPQEFVPKDVKAREVFINRFCSLPYLRVRFPKLNGKDRNKELALLIFKNHHKLVEYSNNISISSAGVFLLNKPNVVIDRNMNAKKTFQKWFSAFIEERQTEFAEKKLKKIRSINDCDSFAEPWLLIDKDVSISNLNTPEKMTEYGKKMRNCLGGDDMIEAAVEGRYIFCEASVGNLLITAALTPLGGDTPSFRLGNVLGVGNGKVPFGVRDQIAKVLSKKFYLIG